MNMERTKSTKNIAKILGLKMSTVRQRVRNIKQDIGVQLGIKAKDGQVRFFNDAEMEAIHMNTKACIRFYQAFKNTLIADFINLPTGNELIHETQNGYSLSQAGRFLIREYRRQINESYPKKI